MKMNTSDEETTDKTSTTSTKTTAKSTHKCSANCNCSASQKRPMNAFLIFCKRHRSVVKQKYPHLENRSITKLLGEWWAKIDLEQKQKYTELARNYKEAFMRANPHFKWYKSDIKLPPNMQPCSPPYLPSFQPSNTTSTTANNSNAPSNLFNNGNSASASASYQTENDNSQPKSNGSSSTNQSELVHHPATNSKTNDKVQDYKSSSSNNLTPKPPKKRYLENGEFKEPTIQASTIATTSSSTITTNSTTTNSTTTNSDCETTTKRPVEAQTTINSRPQQQQPKNYPIGCPPILDVETMNRVIENAFGPSKGADDKKSTSFKSNKKLDSQLFSMQTATNSSATAAIRKGSQLTKDNSKDNETKGDKSNDLRCNEQFNEPNEQFDKATTSSHLNTSTITTNKLIHKKSNDESKSNSPINNSLIEKIVNSSLTSSASNLDKDKLNTTTKQFKAKPSDKDDEDDDKPLNLSTTTTMVKGPTQQVLIDNLIEKFLNNGSTEQGNPMPLEMLQSSSSSYTSSGSSTSSKLQLQNQQRKERSCKGKRYLEMLNENKLSKRSKNTPTSSISNGDDSNSKGANNSSTSSSKWVSCGFDLEEHIAALPQLVGDNHLINVLDSTNLKTDTSSSSQSNDQQSNILLNNNEHNLTKRDGSSPSSKNNSVDYMDTSTASKNENVNENNRQVDLAEKIVERLNINSQAMNECDKLNTLAEIALLQQAHRQPSSISPSCT